MAGKSNWLIVRLTMGARKNHVYIHSVFSKVCKDRLSRGVRMFEFKVLRKSSVIWINQYETGLKFEKQNW